MSEIVLVTTSFPDSGLGGDGSEAAGCFVADLALELATRTRVHVVAPACGDSYSESDGVHVHRFAVPRLPLSMLRFPNPAHWPFILQTLHRGQSALEAVLDRADVGHVLALWILPSGWWARRACLRRGVPYSTWALGSDIWNLADIPFVRGCMRRVLRDGRNRFADGYRLAAEVRGICGLEATFLASARRLPEGRGRRKSQAPPYRLAFLGRWHPHKGVDILLDALDLLTGVDWRRVEEVRICGGGPMHEFVQRRIERLTAAGHPVRMDGFQDRAAAAALLQWADYLLLPSRRESIPVVFSDAARLDTPAVCTPAGDLSRLVRGNGAGIVAAEIDAAAFARALTRALETSPQRFESSLRVLAQRFDISRTAEKILQRCLPPV